MPLNRVIENYEIDLSLRPRANKRAACRRRHAVFTGWSSGRAPIGARSPPNAFAPFAASPGPFVKKVAAK